MIYIKLGKNDWGQILEGLHCWLDDWQGTADIMTLDGDIDGSYEGPSEDNFIIQECSSKEEAQKIADNYRRIIEEIESQLADETNILIKMGL